MPELPDRLRLRSPGTVYSRLNRDCCGAHSVISIRSKSFDGVKLLRYDQVAVADSHPKGSDHLLSCTRGVMKTTSVLLCALSAVVATATVSAETPAVPAAQAIKQTLDASAAAWSAGD